MRLLCTADLHLRADQKESLKTLEWILNRAEELKATCVLVAGDLFDSMADYRELKRKVEKIFDQMGKRVIVVPGNHDNEISTGDYLGRKVNILDEKTSPIRVGENEEMINLFGLPYKDGETTQGFLNNFSPDDLKKPSFLLTHGSLIDPGREYIVRGLEKQEEDNSFIFFTEDLANRGFEVVIIGHWHRGHIFTSNGTDFVYPGSTLPQSSKELGKKSFVLLDADGKGNYSYSVEGIELPENWYYKKKELFVLPGREEDFLQKVVNLLRRNKEKRCSLILEVRGFLADLKEAAFRRAVKRKVEDFNHLYHEITINWDIISESSLSNPLVKRFLEEVENYEFKKETLDEILDGSESTLRPYFKEELEENSDEIKISIMRTGLRAIAEKLNR